MYADSIRGDIFQSPIANAPSEIDINFFSRFDLLHKANFHLKIPQWMIVYLPSIIFLTASSHLASSDLLE